MTANENHRRLITFTRLGRIAQVPLRAVIEGVLYENTLGGIIGRSGSCKSFLAQGMAACVATATPWMGRPVTQGAVFYIGGEGLSGIRKRFAGWAAYNRIDLAQAPLFIADGLPALHDQLNVASVIAEINAIAEDLFFNAGAIEPKLVIVDTLARAMGGADENSAADVGRVIEGLDWIRSTWSCSVQVVHHSGHGEGSKERGRGSSAFYAGLDSELLVQSDGGTVKVRCTKSKDWTPFAEISLDRKVIDVDAGGVVETTLVLDQAQAGSAAERAAELQEEIRVLIFEKKVSYRDAADQLGITKSKLEVEVAKIRRAAQQYSEASDGR